MKHIKKTSVINGVEIEYTHRKSARAKRIKIAIYPGGEVILTTPALLPEYLANRFLKSKSSWIFEKHRQAVNIPKPVKVDTRAEYLKYKTEALRIVKERLAFYNQYYGFKYNRVTIKNHKSLWGSCSKRGNLNFNYKLVLLPKEQMDYVVVHELCHLKEFNHSARFWDLVAQTTPNYKQLRKAIKGLQ